MDQNQTTCQMANKTQIQLVEMEVKTVGLQKLQLLIIERTKQKQNVPTRAQQDTYQDKFNKLLHNKDIDKASKIIALNPTFNDKQLMHQR